MENKMIPVLFESKEDCCGCNACMNICPKSAIEMQRDEIGFFYPAINEEKCIRCYQCIKVCPLKLADK